MAKKYPPQLSLSEATKVIKDIYSIHKSKEVSTDLLPDIFNVSKRSSYFIAKIQALQKFGFADRKPNDVIELTPLAMQIINPIADEDIEAKNIAFHKDEVLTSLLEKYPNGNLPSPEQLKLTLHKSFGIPKETLEKWYKFVVDSFRELPKSGNVKELSTSIDAVSKTGQPTIVTFSGLQNIELPSGKRFSFSIEEGYSLDDLDFIIDFLELKKKRLNK